MRLQLLAALAPLAIAIMPEPRLERLWGGSELGQFNSMYWYWHQNAQRISVNPDEYCGGRGIRGLKTLCLDMKQNRAHYIFEWEEEKDKHCLVPQDTVSKCNGAASAGCEYQASWRKANCTW